jgi:methionyl-tRNA formyltransferase
MKVIFMGTPDFAVPSLKSLIASQNHEVVAVFTQRPKPKGRGQATAVSPINEIAIEHNIPVHIPKTLRDGEVQDLVHSIDADIIVVVAYGFIVPKAILDSKKHGCLNIHPSKLPRFRGAAPLQRTIIAGDKETAVCIMQMDEGLDTGDVLMQQDLVLQTRISYPELHDLCANIGADLLIKTLDTYNLITPTKQSEDGLVYAHKLTKEESKVDFTKSAFEIDCLVRGMNPWPGIYFEYAGEQIKILESDYDDVPHDLPVGYVVDNNLKIACSLGFLTIKKLQRPGKKALETSEFLRGVNIKARLVNLNNPSN